MASPRITPSTDFPFSWEIDGDPALLLGGSREDNLFQIDDVEGHLDAVAAAGGNYVRCTMSSRDPGDVWPFARDEATGLYDLMVFGEEYWRRFERFLRLTAERAIVAQVELWDRFDFARAAWQDNPFNPRNNVNYDSTESTLPPTIDTHPGKNENPFFRSPPGLDDLPGVLGYQRRFIDRLLEATLPYDHLLYCMDNETCADEGWAVYWADYLRAYSERERSERPLILTEMWDPHDLDDPMHERTWRHPERYGFVDVSQGNHKQGQEHWDRLLSARERLSDTVLARPMTMVKIYGANAGHFGTDRDAIERFWRALLAGVSAVRFHRPASGLGLSEPSVACIRSARLLEADVSFAGIDPRPQLLLRRSANEAYCALVRAAGTNDGPEAASRGGSRGSSAMLVFFCDGGDVDLTIPETTRVRRVRWLDVLSSAWTGDDEVEDVEPGDTLRLATPRSGGYWVALLM